MSIDQLLHSEPAKWNPALSNEWGRLSQGNDAGVESTHTIEFIFFHNVPEHKNVKNGVRYTVKEITAEEEDNTVLK